MPQRLRYRLHDLPRDALMALVRGYRFALSPWLGSSCRFTPSCSTYSLQALQRHGAVAGTYLTAARLLRCHPFCAGGHDDVPEHPPRLFSRWLEADTVATTSASTPSSPFPPEKTSP